MPTLIAVIVGVIAFLGLASFFIGIIGPNWPNDPDGFA